MAESGDPGAALRRGFAACMGQLGLALELLAEDVVGDEDARIDWIASAPDGRAFVVLVEPDAAEPALLERGLVQRAWVEARIPDWRQLAPGLALREGLTPGLVLVARDHGRRARIAAREAGGDTIRLVCWDGDPERPALSLLEAPARARPRQSMTAPRLHSVFRSGLSDTDLAS